MLTNALTISVLLSVAWIGDVLYSNASDPLSELWRRAWIIPALRTLLAFVLLVVICILLAPSDYPTSGFFEAPEENEEKDAQAQARKNRWSTVIEKIERMYVGHGSSEEEEDVPLDDVPDDDEYDTEDTFVDDTKLGAASSLLRNIMRITH
ncbi:UNVERIFIED_CONTAM: hypothetical protein Sradi_2992800 [Sesamum radiatum]|uniref:GOST seven transmembrane domain-containing protein n=1 Tax=Sesamum radiatum TaxID=300843 RepID=A0AAW2S044_SESRA